MAAAAVLLAAGTAGAGPRWHDTFAEAQKLAAEVGRPLVLVYLSDPAQVRAVGRMFDRPPLPRFHRAFVFVYEVVTVRDNQVFSPLFHKFSPAGMTIRLPLVLIFFISPDGTVLHKMAGEQSPENLTLAMQVALRKHGPLPSLDALRQARHALRAADARLAKEDYAAAARLAAQVAQAPVTKPLQEAARKRLAAVEEAVRPRLAEALRLRDLKAYPQAVAALTALQRDFAPVATGKQAAAELDKLRKVPAAQAAFQALAKAPPGGPPAAAPAPPVERPRPEDAPNAFTEAELDALDELSAGGFAGEPAARPAEPNPQALRLLRFARNWMANRQPEKARRLLRQVLDLYPASAEAEQARALLEKLD